MKKICALLTACILLLSLSVTAFADNEGGLDTSYSITESGNVLVTASIIDITVDDGFCLLEYYIDYDKSVLELVNVTVDMPDEWKEYVGTDLEPEDWSGLVEPGQYFWCMMILQEGCGIVEDGKLNILMEFKPLSESDTEIKFHSGIFMDDYYNEYNGPDKTLNITFNTDETTSNVTENVISDDSSNATDESNESNESNESDESDSNDADNKTLTTIAIIVGIIVVAAIVTVAVIRKGKQK